MPLGGEIDILKTMEKYAQNSRVPIANEIATANTVPNKATEAGAIAPANTQDLQQQQQAQNIQQQQHAQVKKIRRTPGLWAYDTLLYPVLNNVVVFGVSVAATYLTARGGDRTAAGKLKYGRIGEWFQKRGDWMTKQFKKTGMNDDSATMAKTVFFSFADGSIMAPFIKVLEDNREKFAKGIDDMMGTRPADDSVYEAEPKQTWGSVLAGRALTAGIVVPTAMALDKTGLNNKLFLEPGVKLGKWIKKRPNVAKWFGNHDIGEITKITFFEAFYTSVCTFGLYISSRFLAAKRKPHENEAAPAPIASNAPLPEANTQQMAAPSLEGPSPKIQTQSSLLESDRVASVPTLAMQGG
jgi:hypothetical protein